MSKDSSSVAHGLANQANKKRPLENDDVPKTLVALAQRLTNVLEARLTAPVRPDESAGEGYVDRSTH